MCVCVCAEEEEWEYGKGIESEWDALEWLESSKEMAEERKNNTKCVFVNKAMSTAHTKGKYYLEILFDYPYIHLYPCISFRLINFQVKFPFSIEPKRKEKEKKYYCLIYHN